jgi:hypothetical protein
MTRVGLLKSKDCGTHLVCSPIVVVGLLFAWQLLARATVLSTRTLCAWPERLLKLAPTAAEHVLQEHSFSDTTFARNTQAILH